MTTPFKNDYAFGLQVGTANGRKVIDHGGGIEGFNTELAYYPDDKLTVVVLGNLNGAAPGAIALYLGAVALGRTVTLPGERKEIAIDPSVLSRCVGEYELSPGNVLTIAVDEGHLRAQRGRQPPVAFFPQSETAFFARVVDAQLEFSGTDARGRATQVTLHQNGRDAVAKRLVKD